MNSLRMRKQVLATHEAHIAFLDLKKFVDDATDLPPDLLHRRQAVIDLPPDNQLDGG
jgi:hypothetical protein